MGRERPIRSVLSFTSGSFGMEFYRRHPRLHLHGEFIGIRKSSESSAQKADAGMEFSQSTMHCAKVRRISP
jgi:hypothetical protein